MKKILIFILCLINLNMKNIHTMESINCHNECENSYQETKRKAIWTIFKLVGEGKQEMADLLRKTWNSCYPDDYIPEISSL